MKKRKRKPTPDCGIFKGKSLPQSCIESAVHAIQCINANAVTNWVDEDTTTNGVGVWAVFGNKMICINRVSDIQNKVSGVTGYPDVNTSLMVGRGIALVNCTSHNAKFNMHFGAVLSGNLTKMTITDLSENGPIDNVAINESNLMVSNSTNVMSKFRGTDYQNPDTFKAGLLISESDTEFAAIKSGFCAVDIIDEAPGP